jgi:hypothetical protein
MGLTTIYVTGVPGRTRVRHPALAFAEVMLVMREGRGLAEASGNPVGNEFKHNPSLQEIQLPDDLPVNMIAGGGDPNNPNDVGSPEEFIIQLKTI